MYASAAFVKVLVTVPNAMGVGEKEGGREREGGRGGGRERERAYAKYSSWRYTSPPSSH